MLLALCGGLGCGSDPGTVSTRDFGPQGGDDPSPGDASHQPPRRTAGTGASGGRSGANDAGVGDEPGDAAVEESGPDLRTRNDFERGLLDPNRVYSRFVFDHEGYIGPSDDPYRGLGEAGGDRAVIHPISGRVIYQTATHGVWSFFPSKLLRGDEVATLVSDPATMFDGWTASDERIDDETCGATKFWIDPDTGTIVYRCPGDPDGAYRTDAGTELELGGELVHIGRGGHMLVVRSVLGLDGSHHNVTHVVDAEGNAVAVNSDASAARWIRAAPAGFLMVGQYVDTFWRWHIGYDGSTGTDGIYTVPEGIGRRDSGSIAARCEAILPNGDTVCLGMREAQPVIVQLSVDPDVEPRVVAEIVNDTRGQAQDLLTGP